MDFDILKNYAKLNSEFNGVFCFKVLNIYFINSLLFSSLFTCLLVLNLMSYYLFIKTLEKFSSYLSYYRSLLIYNNSFILS